LWISTLLPLNLMPSPFNFFAVQKFLPTSIDYVGTNCSGTYPKLVGLFLLLPIGA
jgi:hypothetical protein